MQVDCADVHAAKATRLRTADAATAARAPARFPLRAARWAAVIADFRDAHWMQACSSSVVSGGSVRSW